MRTYQIGEVGFSPEACELRRDGLIEHLQPQARNVLLVLIEHAGEVVSKDVLLKQVWHGRSTSEECLTRCISLLQQQLSHRGADHLIETIPQVGYRLRLDLPSPSNDPFHAHWTARAQGALAPDQLVRITITAASLLAITGIFLAITV